MPSKAAMHIVGRYRLDSVVGQGSSAEVWAAWDTVLSRRVAVKLLGPRTDLEKSRIWREARLAALLGETAAVPIYDFGDDGELCFLVMELVSEPSLREFLCSNPELTWESILGLSRHLLEALGITHAMSIVHRDIKPENLFVVGNSEGIERVRMVDFGLAFVEETSDTSLGRLTEERVVSGTPAYLSPEQAKGDPIDLATDVYSAGCVLYEIACGTPPFTGSLAEILSKHMYVPPIPLRQREVALPDAWLDLVEAMLVKAPEQRITASDALAIVMELVDAKDSSLERRTDRVQQRSRADRMVQAKPPSDVPHESRTMRATADEPPPPWLIETLESAGVVLANTAAEAELHLVAADGDVPQDRTVPWVAWLDDTSSSSLADLISRGVDFAVTRQTPASRLRRTLERLSKPPAVPGEAVS